MYMLFTTLFFTIISSSLLAADNHTDLSPIAVQLKLIREAEENKLRLEQYINNTVFKNNLKINQCNSCIKELNSIQDPNKPEDLNTECFEGEVNRLLRENEDLKSLLQNDSALPVFYYDLTKAVKDQLHLHRSKNANSYKK